MIYKRTKVLTDGTVKEYPHYWYKFVRDGREVRHNTKQSNRRTAEDMESQHRARVARGEADLPPGKIPTLATFNPTLTSKSGKASSTKFYADRMRSLLEFKPLANARLSHIDDDLIERFKADRRGKDSPATINRSLSTLRKALRLAYDKRLIARLPKFTMEPGERLREFILNQEVETVYLAACPDPLADAAAFILQTGLRLGEAVNLKWSDITADSVHIRQGKTKNAKRTLDLTPDAAAILERRKATSVCAWIFPNEAQSGPAINSTLDHQHKRVRDKLHLDVDFVLHSLRHTALTRMVDSGVDSFTLKAIAGHDSVVTSERYVHTSSAAIKAAFVGYSRHTVGTRSKKSP